VTSIELFATSIGLFTAQAVGLWLARRRTAGEPAGCGACWYFRDRPKLELLYGVVDAHVKSGYGSAIARAVVTYGIHVLRTPSIRARTDTPHAGSRRLLDCLGFRVEREEVVGGLAAASCELNASGDWARE
jgi:RimJ/RimL family protein N-acetyltransferase